MLALFTILPRPRRSISGEQGVRQVDGRGQVHLDQRVDEIEVVLLQRTALEHTRVLDQNAQAATVVAKLVERPLDVRS